MCKYDVREQSKGDENDRGDAIDPGGFVAFAPMREKGEGEPRERCLHNERGVGGVGAGRTASGGEEERPERAAKRGGEGEP